MKKQFTMIFLASLLILVPAAAQTGNVAIGPVYSLNFLGIQSPLQGLGITGKIPGLDPLFGLNFSFGEDENFLGITADWILYKQPLYKPFNLNFYLGPGFYSSLYFADSSRVDLGLRIPVGINWVPVDFLEVFFELTPAFGVTISPSSDQQIQPAWIFQSAVGARVWF
jgi:hypothetical protein